MTRLRNITPTPTQAADAYREYFADAFRAAGGRDGRISRSEAEALAKRTDASKLVADNILAFLDETGQKSVSVRKIAEVVADYVKREAEAAAGPNQRLSLLEIRAMPKDLIDDLLHLRGRDRLAPPPPSIELTEEGVYEVMFYRDDPWRPTETVEQGTIRPDGDGFRIEDLGPVRADWEGPVRHVLARMWPRGFVHRVWNDEPLHLGRSEQGTLRLGEVIDADTRRPGLLVHWNDIDDNSHAFFFEKDARGQWQESKVVFLN